MRCGSGRIRRSKESGRAAVSTLTPAARTTWNVPCQPWSLVSMENGKQQRRIFPSRQQGKRLIYATDLVFPATTVLNLSLHRLGRCGSCHCGREVLLPHVAIRLTSAVRFRSRFVRNAVVPARSASISCFSPVRTSSAEFPRLCRIFLAGEAPSRHTTRWENRDARRSLRGCVPWTVFPDLVRCGTGGGGAGDHRGHCSGRRRGCRQPVPDHLLGADRVGLRGAAATAGAGSTRTAPHRAPTRGRRRGGGRLDRTAGVAGTARLAARRSGEHTLSYVSGWAGSVAVVLGAVVVAAAGHNHRPTGPALTGRLAVGALVTVLLATVAWTCGQALSRPLPPLFDGVDHTTADADSPD